MDTNLRRAIISEEGSILGFLASLFTNPISLILTLFVLFTLLSQTSILKRWFPQLFRIHAKKSKDEQSAG